MTRLIFIYIKHNVVKKALKGPYIFQIGPVFGKSFFFFTPATDLGTLDVCVFV